MLTMKRLKEVGTLQAPRLTADMSQCFLFEPCLSPLNPGMCSQVTMISNKSGTKTPPDFLPMSFTSGVCASVRRFGLDCWFLASLQAFPYGSKSSPP